MTIDEVHAIARETEQELLVLDGFDDCIVGVGERFNGMFVIYDRQKVIESLMRDGMTDDEAVEYYNFNIVGAWLGDGTPCFVMKSYSEY